MAFRIPHNVEAANVHRWLSNAQFNLNRSLERLASGYRINRAADDATGLAIANNFRQQISSLKMAYNNASQATSMIQVAEGSTNRISDILNRLKELATEAASDTVDSSRRTYLHNEAYTLLQEIDRIASTTKYAGQALFTVAASGSVSFTFQVGYENNSHNRISLTIDALSSASLGINSIRLDNLSSAQSALANIDSALTNLSNVQANLGKTQNRLQYTQQNLQVQIENFTASESTIRDVDMAAEMAEFTKNQILVQTSMAMLAQANSLPQNIIQLLR
ncbi:MAG: flagellin FliC [Candidatus Desulfofervidaceae bacterium]|nr:flagellin FliC [Candidatus Desulfofervidaceae bacterium]